MNIDSHKKIGKHLVIFYVYLCLQAVPNDCTMMCLCGFTIHDDLIQCTCNSCNMGTRDLPDIYA